MRLPTLILSVGCALAGTFASAILGHADDLCPLSDEFDDPATLSDWTRVHEFEGWFADQLELLEIDGLHPGAITLMPYSVTWYRDYRGPFLFKEVDGDFAVTTAVTVTGRDGVSVPSSDYSLGGLFVREPRAITPETWLPGGENYVFLSLGRGNSVPPSFQFEVKTTIDSDSQLELTPASGPSAEIQTARLGEYVIALRREPGGTWTVHRRYHRPDFGATLQVGMVAYTDWEKCSHFDPFHHNSVVITPPLEDDPSPGTPFIPDVLARFDWVRFARVELPAHLGGLDLTDPGAVPDAELLAFLGENAVPDPLEPCDPAGMEDSGEGGAIVTAPDRGVFGAVFSQPHPVRDRSVLALTLHASARLEVRLYDVAGRDLGLLHEGVEPAGRVEIPWSVEAAGPQLAGTYWLRVRAFDPVHGELTGVVSQSIRILD